MQSILSTLRTILTSTVALLAIGGALGTNARYWLSVWIGEASWRTHGNWLSFFPVGTFVINVTGSFILGLVGFVFTEKLPEYGHWYLLLGTGFCGGYTTFSSFEWETLRMVNDKSYLMSAVYVLGSVALGFMGVMLGAALGELLYRNS